MDLPANIHVSNHPCLVAKLSQLRSKNATAKEVKSLVHEIALIVGCEALASSVSVVDGPKCETPIGMEYTTKRISPETVCLVPILRSGLAMTEGLSSEYKPAAEHGGTNMAHARARALHSHIAIQTLLPEPVPVHHLGLYREPTTLEPVEYYNNLPNHVTSTGNSQSSNASSLAFILDPVIATGGTCAAAIQTLREWGARRIVVLSVIAAADGIKRAANEWPEGVEIWVAGVDGDLTDGGMLRPGLGDVGDRLFLTIGK